MNKRDEKAIDCDSFPLPKLAPTFQNLQFREIINQDKAKTAFFKAVAEGRVPHALILMGPEGVGKLPFANAIAQYLNCENPGEEDSCGKCPSCSKIRKGIHPDIRFIFPLISKKEGDRYLTSDDYFDKFRPAFLANPYFSLKEWTLKLEGDNKQLGIFIHEIRELKKKLSLKAFEAKNKVAIIWNAERINHEASNAFLKLLEEPPKNTILILTVSDPGRLLSTINSRCQRLLLTRVPDSEIEAWLVEKQGVESDQAKQISQICDGSVSRALELSAESEKSLSQLFYQWVSACKSQDYNQYSQAVSQVASGSREFQKLFLSFAQKKFRDAMLVRNGIGSIVASGRDEIPFMQDLSLTMNPQGADRLFKLMEDSIQYISRNASASLVLTVLSIKVSAILGRKG